MNKDFTWPSFWARYANLLSMTLSTFFWQPSSASAGFSLLEIEAGVVGNYVGGQRGEALASLLRGVSERLLSVLASLKKTTGERQDALDQWQVQWRHIALWIHEAARSRHVDGYESVDEVHKSLTKPFADMIVSLSAALVSRCDAYEPSQVIVSFATHRMASVFAEVTRPMSDTMRDILRRVN